jgi:hypothetical protein
VKRQQNIATDNGDQVRGCRYLMYGEQEQVSGVKVLVTGYGEKRPFSREEVTR